MRSQTEAGSKRAWAVWSASIVATSLVLAACGGSGSSSTLNEDTTNTSENPATSVTVETPEEQLILLLLPFPCGLNDYAQNTCDGAEEAAANLPEGFSFEIKAGLDYGDVQAFNALIQNSLQLDPTGLIVFVNGPNAQTPFLNEACDEGAKVIWYDAAGEGVECVVSHVNVPTFDLGEKAAAWLIDNPPANGSKKVAIVSQQPGQFVGNDERVKGFQDAVEAAGFEVVQILATTNDLEETRSKVTNMLTANPDLGAIFSANGPMGNGTEQAVRATDADVVLLATDGNLPDIPSVLDGTVGVNIAFNPFQGGKTAVEYMVKVLQGEEVPELTFMESMAVDIANAQEYVDAGGMRGMQGGG